MYGKAQAIVSATVLALLGWIVVEQRVLCAQLNRDSAEVRTNITDLRENMARLAGLFKGHLDREAVSKRDLEDVFARLASVPSGNAKWRTASRSPRNRDGATGWPGEGSAAR